MFSSTTGSYKDFLKVIGVIFNPKATGAKLKIEGRWPAPTGSDFRRFKKFTDKKFFYMMDEVGNIIMENDKRDGEPP